MSDDRHIEAERLRDRYERERDELLAAIREHEQRWASSSTETDEILYGIAARIENADD